MKKGYGRQGLLQIDYIAKGRGDGKEKFRLLKEKKGVFPSRR